MDEHQQGDITIKSDEEYFNIDAGIPRPSKADLELKKKNTTTMVFVFGRGFSTKRT